MNMPRVESSMTPRENPVAVGAGDLGHVLEVHAVPSAEEDGRHGDGGEGGEDRDAFVGLAGGFVEVEIEGDEEGVAESGEGFLLTDEAVAQVAEVGQHEGADDLAIAVGEAVDDVALGADDLAEVGELGTDGEEIGGEVLGVLLEDAGLDALDLGADAVEDRGVAFDELVDDVVGEAVCTAGDDTGALGAAVGEPLDGAQGLAVEGDEVLLAEEQIELGGGEVFGLREVDGVGDDEEEVLVVLDLGELEGVTQSSMARGWNWKTPSRTSLISSSVGFSRSTQRWRPLSARTRRMASASRSLATSLPSLNTNERIMRGRHGARHGRARQAAGGGDFAVPHELRGEARRGRAGSRCFPGAQAAP
jgi:hypothetical protein